MTFVAFQCPNCGSRVRGDVAECSSCGEAIAATAWTKAEQRAEDLNDAGRCELCERPLVECGTDSCVEESE